MGYHATDAMLAWIGTPAADALPQSARTIALAIAHRADDSTLVAWPSAKKLATAAGVSRRTATTALAALRSAGAIEPDPGPDPVAWLRIPRGRRPKRYRVTVAVAVPRAHSVPAPPLTAAPLSPPAWAAPAAAPRTAVRASS